ncbi:MAG: RluA family pseudouridine synthase [Clostridiales Family XIII bacterium]|jgi:23S rRNA pseudouridine955/2504/2580 synthase|nr:RluA family pseudouridine synthase [Clostridiales Family XIII bacterium]
MEIITITANEAGQRLDRFLKKYLRAAPLSLVYRLVRKDVKVNGARKGIDYIVEEGDEIALYIDSARVDELSRSGQVRAGGAFRHSRVQFKVCYEDGNILVVSKPYGLLTHGDAKEKKDTLVNQVIGYLLEKGEYNPRAERMFTPSPVNRLDRNTTGLVVFGKNSKAVRDFSRMIAAEDAVRKYYTALVLGEMDGAWVIDGSIRKDEAHNRVEVTSTDVTVNVHASAYTSSVPSTKSAKRAMTIVCPTETIQSGAHTYTIVEVRLVTGRTHQIRAHLAAVGHSIAGDPKYGDMAFGRFLARRYGLRSQFLHAGRIEITEGRGSLEYLTGSVIESALPGRLSNLLDALRQGI